ncbi:MAG TPA: hypothetical protein VNI01_04630 [Elusimicrobiota bacterium]|jgi:hypothetical protein|nr:hypothetical protein [Elusimicrobiota bacterium]
MRTYLVDGSNMVRRGAYDPRFPEVEEARTDGILSRLGGLARQLGSSVRIEIFFDGPRRPTYPVEPPLFIRFPPGGNADDAILGAARAVLAKGRGVIAVTADGGLARDLESEGARVISFSEFEERLRSGRA